VADLHLLGFGYCWGGCTISTNRHTPVSKRASLFYFRLHPMHCSGKLRLPECGCRLPVPQVLCSAHAVTERGTRWCTGQSGCLCQPMHSACATNLETRPTQTLPSPGTLSYCLVGSVDARDASLAASVLDVRVCGAQLAGHVRLFIHWMCTQLGWIAAGVRRTGAAVVGWGMRVLAGTCMEKCNAGSFRNLMLAHLSLGQHTCEAFVLQPILVSKVENTVRGCLCSFLPVPPGLAAPP
jgi:hypothetical protein